MSAVPKTLPFCTLDVFTEKPFAGNQLAVVTIPAGMTLSLSQRAAIAREFNLSETVFVHPEQEGPDGAAVIPLNIHIEDGAEIPWAGHPTVGAGFFSARRLPDRPIILHPLAGAMPVGRIVDASTSILTGARVNVAVDFKDHGRLPVPQLATLQTALQPEDYVGGADAFPVVSIVKGMTFVLVELASEDALARLCPLAVRVRPTEGALGEWEGLVAVYAFVRAGEDGNVTKLRTRLFLGPLEDPATGSAASCLSGWLGKQKGPGKWAMRLTQGVEMKRRSEISVDILIGTASEIGHLELSGSVCEVMHGELFVPEEV